MARYLKKATAATVLCGPFVDSTDGVTAETGLTIAQANIRLSKEGASFAQTHNAAGATHNENGYYSVPLDTTDTNTVGRLRIAMTISGALPVWEDLYVLDTAVYAWLAGSAAPSVAGDKMDLVDAPNSTAIAAFKTGLAGLGVYLTGIMATALTETSGYLAAGFKKFFNVATPTGTVNSLPDAVAGATGGVAIVGSKMDLVDAPNATSITAIQAGLATAAELAKVKGATAGKKIINAAGTQVQVYNAAGGLLVTLDRTGTGPYTWTPTWA